MRASRGLKWENKMYKLKRSIDHEKKSDGVRVYYEKEQLGESSP